AGAKAGSQANYILEKSTEAAIGGVADVTDAVKLGTSVSNAYGKSLDSVEAIFDTIFMTVKGGVTNFSELSSFFYQAVPMASTLGVTFEELNAAISAMTRQGAPAGAVMTQLNSVMTALIDSGLDQYYQKVGFSTAKAAIQAEGLGFALKVIRDAADGSEGKLKEFLGRNEAVKAVLALTGDKAHFLAAAMADMANKTGAAKEAHNKVAADIEALWDEQINKIAQFNEQIGKHTTGAFIPLLQGIGEVLDAIKEFEETYPKFFAVFIKGATYAAVLVAAMGSVTVAVVSFRGVLMLVKPVVAALVSSFTGLKALQPAMWFTGGATGGSALLAVLGKLVPAAGAVHGAFKIGELIDKVSDSLDMASEKSLKFAVALGDVKVQTLAAKAAGETLEYIDEMTVKGMDDMRQSLMDR
ncbi:MAG: phage tail tape measure protein, partial [Gammaproteobacteria bacterium]|nr:phage tail tape measure protein [Gammaproteobacteria bacterium]